MKTVLLVFGTRPEAVKMCPLVRELKRRGVFSVKVALTGQHREMLSPILDTFAVTPDYDLAVMRTGQTLSHVTTAVLTGMEAVLHDAHPHLVLVHGDTTTAFATALASFYQQIPVGHVEAGLRTYDMTSPFPEEFNRRAVGLIAGLHFAPTSSAADNLLREGVPPASVFVTGNTVIDALGFTVRKDFSHPLLDGAEGDRLILLTTHRRENVGSTMAAMLRAVREEVELHSRVRVICPVHKNPAVRDVVKKVLADCPAVHLTEPLDTVTFHNLLARCYLALTDSGGIQEEASALGIPTLILRNTTERPEGVAAGTLQMVGTDPRAVRIALRRLLEDEALHRAMSSSPCPYGDGHACDRIADVLEARLP